MKSPTIQAVRFVIQLATLFCNIPVKLFPLEELEHIHPLVNEIFLQEIIQNAPLRGRLEENFTYFQLPESEQKTKM